MSIVRLFVLGIINQEGKAHGYQVTRELATWQADKWTSLKPGSIYHALGQMEKEQLVRSVGSPVSEKGPLRTNYELTDAGFAEFLNIEKAVLLNNDLNIESFAAGMAFMKVLPRHEVLALLQVRHQLLQDTSAFMHGLPVSDPPVNPSELSPLVGLWSGFFDQLITHSARLIADIESGKYQFTE